MSPTTPLPGTPRLLRAINDRAALELLLSRGPLTRSQIGELTGLSKVTASQLVERLIGRGLVAGVGEQAGGRGPNAQLYAVRPESAYVVGVDVGPEHVVAACADISGAVRSRIELSTKDTDDPVGVVHSAVMAAADKAGAPFDDVRRVVLGTPGLVDPNTGDVAFAFDLPRWQRGLLAQLRDDLHRPVSFENDVNLVAVAEAHSGAAQGVDDFVLLWVSRGVGLGIMIGGKLHRGHSGAAGEAGWIPVPGGNVSRDPTHRAKGGLRGGFQQLVGADGVRTIARDFGFRAATGAAAVTAAVQVGSAGGAFLDELASRLALGLAAVCVVLDPPLVVLAGEVNVAGGPALAQRVEHEVAAIAPVSPRVVMSSGPEEPVVDGALRTALDEVRDDMFGSAA
ncbi:MAG TPA: ROK family transcriptional regulator [Micromonosporaceae bacterium]|jgi:predicted NBD/HSP70 family sugar kinase|nr:ROK family transcriptional regulator [Micromonosporaceae bacterium]